MICDDDLMIGDDDLMICCDDDLMTCDGDLKDGARRARCRKCSLNDTNPNPE